MHPAISVICFTLLSGAGYGLLVLLCLDSVFDIGLIHSEMRRVILAAVALVLVTIGLLCSTFHLANPKNAWRAFFRFRTSWLSREGVFAVLLYPFAILWLVLTWSAAPLGAGGIANLLAGITVLLAIATLGSTGMIYACLKTIRQWNTALTPTNYLLLGLMLGALILLVGSNGSEAAATLAQGLIAIACVSKLIYYYWIGHPAGPTINSALGFTRATVRLLDVGHGSGNFLTDEFGYELARTRLLWLRFISVVCAFILPALLLVVFDRGLAIDGLAMLIAFAGVFVERWLFFAEARHVVNLYHGAQRT